MTTTYTRTTLTARTIGGGTITQTRCQYRDEASASQCRRPEGHGDNRPPGTYPLPGGHVMRWGADPS